MLLPAGKLGRVLFFEAAELKLRDHLLDPLSNLGPGNMPHFEAKGNVLRDRHVRKEEVVLKNQQGVLRRTLTGEFNRSRLRSQHPHDHFQNRRFTNPGRAK